MLMKEIERCTVMSFNYEYSRPALTVDLAVFSEFEGNAELLMIRRGNDPFQGRLALPGGFVEENENPLNAAFRELEEETGIKVDSLDLIGVYGEPGRDPRGHTVSILYGCIVDRKICVPKAGDDAAEAFWLNPESLVFSEIMAFDHHLLVRDACEWYAKNHEFQS
ncbi:MAG: hypothetical protein CVV64_08240 [Candidatus Wallbacteria bacterium HGW-Wallbacteria-1]|uniref:Nudix hydrolase domain-containing protein n=1 Tax=Candidatus Wallbacteria bacterium HGW-Wallbacteria-1 TaxID=2013854 RepID=A0A2N1PRE4_9BACT|nr:MAG: hypothetical protein CVV64_08240 [Candidatus Wallbacteria bacterium HGW-Wallbacteria-1]